MSVACEGNLGATSVDSGTAGSAGFWSTSGSGGVGGFGGVGGLAGTGGTGAVVADASFDAGLSDATFVVDASADGGLDANVLDAGPIEAPAYEALFADDHLPTFEITIPPASWDALQNDGDVYQSGTLTYGSIVLQNVGIRIKGRASRRGLDEKAAFKIKVNEFVPGQRLLGLKRITLNNMVQDPTMARERLGYAMFRQMGVPAPLCNHARVYVNGELWGLYANVQSLDEVFVGSHWSPAPGNLYDITNAEYHIDFEREAFPWDPPQESKFVLETNKDINDTSDLTALIDAVSESSNSNFVSAVEAVMDLDEVLAMGAMQAVISDWDGYFGARNNYKAYHELSQGRFILFPWGIDQTFGIQDSNYNKLDYSIDHSDSERPRSLIYERCEQSSACLARYHEQVATALAVFEAADLETVLDAILLQISPSVMEDPRKEHTYGEHLDGVDDLRDYLGKRADIVRSQLP